MEEGDEASERGAHLSLSTQMSHVPAAHVAEGGQSSGRRRAHLGVTLSGHLLAVTLDKFSNLL